VGTLNTAIQCGVDLAMGQLFIVVWYIKIKPVQSLNTSCNMTYRVVCFWCVDCDVK